MLVSIIFSGYMCEQTLVTFVRFYRLVLPQTNARSTKDLITYKKIGYLKLQKCASTSIQNILLRFAVKNNRNIVLGEDGNILGYDNHFNRKMIQNTIWEKAHLQYHMFLCHTRWDHFEISSILGDNGSDVFYFTFIRDPVDLYRSFWDYNDFSKAYNRTLEEHVATTIVDELKYNNSTTRIPCFNQMLYVFGLDFCDVKYKDKVEQKIKEIDKTFDLILLADTEFFKDSIVLLMNELRWENDDMINMKLNSRARYKQSIVSPWARKTLQGNYHYPILKALEEQISIILYA